MKYGNRKSKLLCSSREIFLTTRKRTIKAKPELESSGRIILIDSFSPCADMEKDKKSAGLMGLQCKGGQGLGTLRRKFWQHYFL
jgi:hypothetical protein